MAIKYTTYDKNYEEVDYVPSTAERIGESSAYCYGSGAQIVLPPELDSNMEEPDGHCEQGLSLPEGHWFTLRLDGEP